MTLLKSINQPGWKHSKTLYGYHIEAPTQDEADELLKIAWDSLLVLAKQVRGNLFLGWKNAKRPYHISVKLAAAINSGESFNLLESRTDRELPNLAVSAQYEEALDFFQGQCQQSKSVNIIGLVDNICYMQNDRLNPERGVIAPHQWIGQNMAWYWRDTMSDYERLIYLLKEPVGKVWEYEHRLRRADGSLARFSTSFYRIDSFYPGVSVRIGVSDLDAWEILRPAAQE